jgi:hypothetical protein
MNHSYWALFIVSSTLLVCSVAPKLVDALMGPSNETKRAGIQTPNAPFILPYWQRDPVSSTQYPLFKTLPEPLSADK